MKRQCVEIRINLQVRWGDKHGGYGEHYWEYNHGPSYKHDGYGKEPSYKEEKAPSYPAPPIPKYPA